MRRTLTAIICTLLGVLVVSSAASGGVPAKKRANDPGRWDVVMILTDDQPTGTLTGMPQLNRLLTSRGVTYSNAVIPTSICCPSRTSLLTGLLATQTGVYSNDSATGVGGYPALKASGLERSTIATALDGAGYDTAYFGKYVNEYGPLYDGTAPPGWDTWRAFATAQASGKYRNYALTDAVPFGQPVKTARREFVRRYSTTFLGQEAADHIRTAAPSSALFTVFAPYAPHSPFTAEKRYRGSNRVPANFFNPSILEQDVSDKPAYVRDLPLSATVEGQAPGINLAKQMDTLRSVDDQIRNLYDAVKASGRLDRTLFVYVSDNGYLHGEHRLDGKAYPYRKSTDVPLVMRWGAGAPGTIDDRLTIANVDIHATILQAAGLPNTSMGTSVLADRNQQGVPLVGTESTSRVIRPPFCAWRTREEVFVRYGTSEEEYYDYRTDPYELTNRINDPAVATRIDELRTLTRKSCSPTPPGFGPEFDLPRWRPARGGPLPPPPEAGDDWVSRS